MKLHRICSLFITAALTALIFTSCGKKAGETAAVPETEAAEETSAGESKAEEKETEAEESRETGTDLSRIKLPDFQFTRENFPRMNGSTSCVPLGRTLAALLLGESEESVGELVNFSRTTQSFRDLAAGESDILIVGEPNAAVYQEMKDSGFAYEMEEFAEDALIFVVNESNPVDNLTTEQIRDIYSGKITNWKEVGGNDAPIIPFQRNEGAGSQALMKKLVMKETEMTEAPSAYVSTEMGELMEAVRSYDNSANAIGYSVYYFANDMRMSEGLKIISVDGVEPNADTIRAKEYPHLNAYYCVIPEAAAADSASRAIYDWIATEDGQVLVASRGYVSVTDTGIRAEAAESEPPMYTKADGDLSLLKEGGDYGLLYPYTGDVEYVNAGDGYAYRAGSMYGFFDAQGRIVTDPVYYSIEPAVCYDYLGETTHVTGAYIAAAQKDLVEKQLEDSTETYPQQMYRYISPDGSHITDACAVITVQDDAVLCLKDYEEQEFAVYDITGELLFDRDDFKRLNPGCENVDTSYANMESSQGILALRFSDQAYYCDRSGKIISGPYSFAQVYMDGVAIAGFDDGSCVLVDMEGTVLHTFPEEECFRLVNGYIAERDGGKYRILTTDGDVVCEVEADSLSSSANGFSTVKDNYGTLAEFWYDYSGNLLYSDETGETEDFTAYNKVAAALNEQENGRQDYKVTDLASKKEYIIKDVDNLHPFYTMEGSADLNYFIAERYEDDYSSTSSQILDADTMQPVLEADGYCSCIRDGLTGEWMIVCSRDDGTKSVVYDSELKRLGEFSGNVSRYYNRFISNDDHSSTAYDENGKMVFRYNFALGDD